MLILGAGNLLLGDDGLGVHALRRLEEHRPATAEVELLDGGTMGLGLLHHLEGVSRLLILDAVDMGMPPGTLIRLCGEQVPVYLGQKLSVHEIGLPDLLCAARLRDLYPQEVVILGLQPASIAVGLDLSPPVAAQMESLVAEAGRQIEQWERTGK